MALSSFSVGVTLSLSIKCESATESQPPASYLARAFASLWLLVAALDVPLAFELYTYGF